MNNVCFTCFVNLLCFSLFAVNVAGASCQEQSPDPSQLGSLKRVPATAGSYWVTTNHQAIVNAVFESNAWQAIKGSHVARGLKKANRRGKTRGYDDYNVENPAAKYLQFYDSVFNNIATQSALEVVKQVVEHEVFYYIDNDLIDVIDAMKRSFVSMSDYLDGELVAQLSDEQKQELLIRAWSSFDKVKCPTMMMGARLEDPRGFRALLEIARIGVESFLNDQAPEFREMLRVVDRENDYVMSFELEFDKIPFDDLDELNAEQLKALRDAFQGKKMVVAIGIIDELVLMGVAEDSSAFLEFGEQELLVNKPELQRLNQSIQRNEAVVSAYYLSKEMADSGSSWKDMLDAMMPMFEMAMAEELVDVSENDREQFKKLPGWITKVVVDVEKFLPKPAMQYGYSVLTNDGIRGYLQQKRLHPGLDGSKKLDVNDFSSQETLLFMTQRPKNIEQLYDAMVEWGNTFPIEFENQTKRQILEAVERMETDKLREEGADLELAESQKQIKDHVDAEEKRITALYDSTIKLVTTLHATTKNRLMPSIKGRQAGLSIDLKKIVSEEGDFLAVLPAIIWRTDSRFGIDTAMDEYLTAITRYRDESKNLQSDSTSEWELPEPVQTKSENGSSSVRWRLGQKLDTNYPLAPGFTTSKERLVFSLIESQAQEILAGRRTGDLFGPAVTNQPSASLFFYDNRVLLKALPSWFEQVLTMGDEFGVPVDFEEIEAKRDTLRFSRKQIDDHANRIWNLLGCWKGYSSRMFEENGALVTEYLYRFEDISSDEN